MKSLLFGTAGIPLVSSSYEEAFVDLEEMGLDAMELEFVRFINISEEKAPIIRSLSRRHNISLTAHGQYYINLNSEDKAIPSMKRVVDAATRAYHSGARSMTFHAAYYLKKDPLEVYDNVKHMMEKILDVLAENDIDITLRPETTGKPSQWGTLKEILDLSQELDNVMPCVDFAHLHARSNGRYNTYDDIHKVLSDIENALGRKALDDMHIHMSGIMYTEKGERHHLPLEDSDLNYKEILKAWKDFDIKGIVISESPVLERDALLLKETWKELLGK